MQNSKILVTIACYNHGKYLKQSVQSIMGQTYKNLDICIVDDGSDLDQGIIEIIDDLKNQDSRVRSITFSKNMGKWHALNESIRTTDAILCTSHDADDISLPERIDRQTSCLIATQTVHNLCGFYHCWSEDDIKNTQLSHKMAEKINVIGPDDVNKLVNLGRNTPGINHYYTGNFETAGVSALYYKQIWDMGIRFNPPNCGLRTLVSEDSDFNFRMTSLIGKTSILAERVYCYRRNTSTNQELT